MTEIEKMQRAKIYLDKLANGINPLDDSQIPEQDVVNQVRLSRCFFYVSDLLRQVIENGGVAPKATAKLKKRPFFLPYEKRAAFPFSEKPIPISEIAKRINELAGDDAMKRLSFREIRNWLLEIGMLHAVDSAPGESKVKPTENGKHLGILTEDRLGQRGQYSVIVYNIEAQHFIMDNLDAILNP